MLEATSTCETNHAIVHDFPRATANPVEVPREESAALADPSFLLPISSIRPAHVLVIGDNLKLMPRQWREMFPGPTRRVHFAATGRVALKHVRTHSPDVILL